MKNKNNKEQRTNISRLESKIKPLEKNAFKRFFHLSWRDSFIAILAFGIVTGISFFFYKRGSDPTLNIAMLYTLAIVIISRFTEGNLYGIIFSVAAVLAVNYFFTYPYKEFNFTFSGYGITFVGMLLVAVMTSLMSTMMRDQNAMLLRQEKELMDAEKEKMRANLLRAISHDLRTPLTGIIGNASSYLEVSDEMSEEEKENVVKTISDDANWLLNMVENLLTVTKIDSEEPENSINASAEIVDEVVSSAVVQFKKRFPNTAIHVKIPDNVLMCKMDPTLIQQVIINILQNAHVHAHSNEPLELTVEENGEEVWFRIRDYGIGIDPGKLETIFDGSGYSKQDRGDSYKGMGIGLSICKTIIQAHGGKIWAINHKNGCEFIFALKKESE